MLPKKFMELLSSDEKVNVEALMEGVKELQALAVEKGFKDEAREALDRALEKVAEAHGFKSDEAEELDMGDLKAVAGGQVIDFGKPILCYPVGKVDKPCPWGFSQMWE